MVASFSKSTKSKRRMTSHDLVLSRIDAAFIIRIDLKYTLLGAASVSVQVNYEDDDGLRIAGNLPVGR